jgi:hypothetical protein
MIGTAVVITAATGQPAPVFALVVAGSIGAAIGGMLLVRAARRARLRAAVTWPTDRLRPPHSPPLFSFVARLVTPPGPLMP